MLRTVLLILIIFLACGMINASREAIVLNDKHIFIIEDQNSGTYTRNLSILILGEGGKRFGTFNLNEDKYKKLKELKAVIKDTAGTVLKELDKEDIITSSFSSGVLFHSDDQRTYIDLSYSRLPYIIEIQFKLEIHTHFIMASYAKWQPQWSIPVAQSSFSLIEKTTLPYRQFIQGIDIEPTVTIEGGNKISTWHMTDITPSKKRAFMPPEDQEKMLLLLAPYSFSIDDISGSFQTWEDFGQWYLKLINEQDSYHLPEEVHHEILALVDGVADPRLKIQLVYQYLQENSRYVAIELGIGSWQPYPAKWVYENKFGDCKDLSNFMIALLKIVGIKAYPVLIKTRDQGIVYPNFPLNNFNHVICCVPLESDTVWLECTADHLMAGELDYTDEGCNVLLIDNNGSRLIKTPQSTSKDNKWEGKLEGRLSRNGSLNFNASINTSGKDKQYFLRLVKETKSSEQELILKKYLCNNYIINHLNTYQFIQSPNNSKGLTIKMSGEIANIGRSIGKRIFFNANIFHSIPRVLSEEEDSTAAILFDYPYSKTDTITISLPILYQLEIKPKDVFIESPYGIYYTQTTVSGNKLNYIRTFEQRMRYISENQYLDFLAFYNKAIKADTGNFIFVKK